MGVRFARPLILTVDRSWSLANPYIAGLATLLRDPGIEHNEYKCIAMSAVFGAKIKGKIYYDEKSDSIIGIGIF